MEQKSLYKLFYIDRGAHKTVYEQRFNSEDSIHLGLKIDENEAFFCPTNEMYRKILAIERTDKVINELCLSLPEEAVEQFAARCLIDEIMLTNNIEGVYSTRKELTKILESLSKHSKKGRFVGLVNEYAYLMSNVVIPINTPKDIRKIYDKIFYDEIKNDDESLLPDGKLFRKSSVSVYSSSGKEIHKGLMPESKLIDYMKKSIHILNDDNIEVLFRIAIFHYLFGYIHPFYDGNGRMSRFISSYLLYRELNNIIGYRISMTIKENISEYYEAFKICNHRNNMGDLTPFVEMFIDIIETAINKLKDALTERKEKLDLYKENIINFPGGDRDKMYNIYFLLIQAALFSENGISTEEIAAHIGNSLSTVRSRLSQIPEEFITTMVKDRKKYYCLNLETADKIIKNN